MQSASPRRRADGDVCRGQPGGARGRNPSCRRRHADRAVAGVPRDPLAPHRCTETVPADDGLVQLRTARVGLQRGDDRAAQFQLLAHALQAYSDVGDSEPRRGGDVVTAQRAGAFLPPQRQQHPMVRVEPPAGFDDLTALVRHMQTQDRHVLRFGAGVRYLECLVDDRGPAGEGALPVPVGIDLAERDRHQPGPEALRGTQGRQVAHHAQQGFLDDVVDVGMSAQRSPDDVVEQRQVRGDQLLARPIVTGLRRGNQPRVVRIHEPHSNLPQGSDPPSTAPHLSVGKGMRPTLDHWTGPRRLGGPWPFRPPSHAFRRCGRGHGLCTARHLQGRSCLPPRSSVLNGPSASWPPATRTHPDDLWESAMEGTKGTSVTRPLINAYRTTR